MSIGERPARKRQLPWPRFSIPLISSSLTLYLSRTDTSSFQEPLEIAALQQLRPYYGIGEWGEAA
jgi:hypothetical protein